MTNREIYERLAGVLGTYGGGSMGPTYMDQYNNARLGLEELDSLGLDENGEQYKSFASQMKGQKANAVIGGGLTALNAGVGMINTANNLSQIADTSMYEDAIDERGRIGQYGYNSFGQIANDYDTLSYMPDISYDSIRGMTDGQKVGNVLQSAMTGASAGAQIGGLWGGIAGGALGIASGIGGWVTGDRKAKSQQTYLKNQADLANQSALSNLNAANESLIERNDRKGAVRSVADGGKIDRVQMSVDEFIRKSKSSPVRRSGGNAMSVVRKRTDGGVMVRIKVR